jgi:hypothetical protein
MALTACMRKLVVILNAMLKAGADAPKSELAR